VHSHLVAANLTYDGEEGRCKALQASDIYEQRDYLTEVYRNALAARVNATLSLWKGGAQFPALRDEHDLTALALVNKQVAKARWARGKSNKPVEDSDHTLEPTDTRWSAKNSSGPENDGT
jgi:hypothetical protein